MEVSGEIVLQRGSKVNVKSEPVGRGKVIVNLNR